MVGRFANASIRTAVLGAAVALAPPALAERDLGSQAACLNKQMRKQGGGEAGRTAALLAHFECFPDTPLRFSQLFEGAGPLAGYPDGHFELFFAARGAVPEREWSDKAVAVLAGGEWRGGAAARYAQLLRLAIASRPTGPLDAVARLDDAAIVAFWRVLFGSAEGFLPDWSLCRPRPAHRACQALAALK